MPDEGRSLKSQRWIALAVVATVAPLAVYCTAGGAAWLGRPFPGFFVAENRSVPSIGRFEWTGLRAGVPFHARVVAIEGRPIATSEELYAHAASVPIGTPVRYGFEKAGGTIERTVPTMRFEAVDLWLTTGLFALNGWLPLAAGALIFYLQPARRAARVFLLMCVTFALFALSGAVLYRPPGPWVAPLHFASQALLPATFAHLAGTFPVERALLARRRWLLALPYGLSAALAVTSVAGFYAEPPDLRPLYVVWTYSAAAIAFLWVAAGWAYLERRSEEVRRQARIVLAGLLAGTGVAFVVFLDNAQGGGRIPMNLIALTPVLFFVAVGYAIVRHNLFAPDRLVRYAVEYAILTLLITLGYAATLVGAERLVGPGAGATPALTVLFVVTVAFAFDPLRRRVQYAIDRTFFRNRPDYGRTLREVSAALATMLDLRAVVTRVGEALRESLALERVTIGLWLDGDERVHWCSDPALGPDAATDATLRAHLERDGRRVARGALEGGLESATVALREAMDRLGATLAVPLALSGRPLGYVALGPKRSGRPYGHEDLELLATLTNQAAIAVQNAASYRQLQELNRRLEEKVEARTAELTRSNAELASAYQRLQATQGQLIQAEKMASLGQLVAGVAHELNNPLTFIVGNVAPIREQLAAVRLLAQRRGDRDTLAICDDMTQILNVIGSGAERTAAIVKDLRTFSRIEDGAWSIADLAEGLRVTINLLRPRWKDRIAIHAEMAGIPRIECDPGQVNQVFMNILSNACDAIGGPGNIWIRARADGGMVAISIRDDGTGIDPGHLPRIFDPFFTTKEVGRGTGLGLAIAHGIVQRHQGRIDVASEPGRGTEVTVHLPVREPRRSVA
jgi:signal transduction histidine kinase